ncbi:MULTISPECIES: class I SAM-dependent DNA methyltransferase [Pseudomonas]|jgi:SAM-dependent methyltransferase|uniref:Methyltransferase domain-containing protein n=1 Tax=Pseudomonas weihenstephanensis TaxID=1608994 RepID=A0ABS1ZF00_9PSED|nr:MULTISPECIES: SAM-dependent methyltransferase [Pseudomonas]KVV04310.1 3-demethylubiquinone-9 3-O-methyltransferase [Pseudomonas sp. TAD18]KVV05856.1 3-demethylubiquinone-9 3-O-methyltransferase [Pseudomonas sp. TAA207]MBM1195041.1 methyltransferase domain-containing protein [Pseudomonas weihenstephanensis]
MSVSTAFFDQLYADNSDPWAFRERWYEQRKRAVTLASLPRQHYPAIFEIGCANGELSAGLAQRTGALLACDAAARAVDLARQRLSHCAHVQVHQSRVPEQWPEHRFDLIVISEVAYYLDAQALKDVLERAINSLAPDGHLLACHWRPPIEGCVLTGDEVHALIHDTLKWPRLVQHLEDDFILEVWGRDPISVASREGLR